MCMCYTHSLPLFLFHKPSRKRFRKRYGRMSVCACVRVFLFHFNGVAASVAVLVKVAVHRLYSYYLTFIPLQIELTHSLLCGCHFFSLCVNKARNKVNCEGKKQVPFKGTKTKTTKKLNYQKVKVFIWIFINSWLSFVSFWISKSTLSSRIVA